MNFPKANMNEAARDPTELTEISISMGPLDLKVPGGRLLVRRGFIDNYGTFL